MPKPTAALALLAALVTPVFAQPATPGDQPAAAVDRSTDARPVFPQYPVLSPDARFVVFTWSGDLWSAPAQGGAATRLTLHPADERRAAFSPDGSMLAFESDRDGARNLYIMSLRREGDTLLGGAVRRVTISDRGQSLAGFAPDARSLTFASFEPSIFRMGRLFEVPLSDRSPFAASTLGGVTGGPITRISDAFGSLPRYTPDRSAIIFQRGSTPPDRAGYRGSQNWRLWKQTLADGSFTQLTSGPGNDFDAHPVPDGSIIFTSSRDGQNNVFRLPPSPQPGGGQPVQLTTFKPAPGELTIGHGIRDLSVTSDGRNAVFAVWDRLYRLDLATPGAAPQPITLTAEGDETSGNFQRLSVDREVSEAALSPDGKTIAVVARGDIFVRPTTEGLPTRRVTASVGRERDLAWSPDGRVLYFASDDPSLGVGPDALGKYAIYAASVSLAREDLAPSTPQPRRAARPAPDAGAEPKTDPKADPGADPQAQPPAPLPTPGTPGDDALDEPPAPPDPDPKAAPKADPKPEAGDEAKPAPRGSRSPAPRRVDFGKRWQEALRFSVEPVVVLPDADARRPVPSPDARLLMYNRGLGDMVLRDLKDGSERMLLSSWDDAEVVWAADSRHVVYAVSDLDFNSDIWLLDTLATGAFAPDAPAPAPINLTRHPDNDVSPRLSADGKVLTFLSERSSQDDAYDVHQVYLDKELEAMTAFERDEYIKKATEAASRRRPVQTPDWATPKTTPAGSASAKPDDEPKPEAKSEPKSEPKSEDDPKPDADAPASPSGRSTPPAPPRAPTLLSFDAADAYMRIRRVTSSPGSKFNLAVTPGADRIIFSAPGEPEPSLVSIDHKGGDRKPIQAGAVSNVTVSLTGDRVAFLRTGQAFTAPKAGGKVDAWAIDAPIVVDLSAQQTQKFLEAARTFGARFYHPTLKGLDWPGLTRRYLDLARGVRTSDEFNRIIALLFFELNASHTGASGGPGFSAPSPAIGYLGVSVEPVAGGYRVTAVTPDSPADRKAPAGLRVGDVITAIDGVAYAPTPEAPPAIDLNALLVNKAGRETLIEVRRAADAPPSPPSTPSTPSPPALPAPTTIILVPISNAAFTNLAYRDEVRRRRAAADELSGGRIGYLHIRAMAEPEVRDFERDLYAAAHGKDALIIDVRDNGGGSTADVLLASLTAPRHAYTAPGGVDLSTVPRDAYPRDRRLIYGYTRPIAVLINQNSFSNAEIFAHAIKTTGRGPLIGEPTAGGVISTGAFSLIDGTSIRMPFRGWYLPDGTDMENNGATPDILVPLTPEHDAAKRGQGRDPQLEAAVTELLKRLSEPGR